MDETKQLTVGKLWQMVEDAKKRHDYALAKIQENAAWQTGEENMYYLNELRRLYDAAVEAGLVQEGDPLPWVEN